MSKKELKQVVTVRLAGWERFTLLQLADILEVNRSDALRHVFVETVRRMMLAHPQWPLHPAWARAGNDRWVLGQFQHWAYAITHEEPTRFLEPISLDGVAAYRLRGEACKPQDWMDHIERYHERQKETA